MRAGEAAYVLPDLAQLLDQQGRREAATNACRDAADAKVQHARYGLARRLAGDGRTDEAIWQFRAAAAEGDTMGIYGLVRMFAEQNRIAEAIANARTPSMPAMSNTTNTWARCLQIMDGGKKQPQSIGSQPQPVHSKSKCVDH